MNILKNSMNQFTVFRQRFGAGSMMKSTQEKAERQQNTQNQIEYWENRKESLKQTDCGTVEEIVKKLELLHSYEDEIAAAKKAYNFEQMRHVLDEAEERGEKIAEAAEKNKPKTEEERKKEALEEAAGTENTGGILEELSEELPEELSETMSEEMEDLSDGLREEMEALPQAIPEEMEVLSEKLSEETVLDNRDMQLARERYANMIMDEEADKGVWFNYKM
jgi:hypothetical protein